MRVLVTGVAGRVGSVTAREFLNHGWDVRGLDQFAPPAELRGDIETVYADLADRLAILKAVEGCDAIAHLGAIPHPGDETHIFQTNVTGTQYLFAAAEAHGVRRVALASTCCVYGIYFARHPFDPDYLPLDEAHPVKPQDMYGLSKRFNEETAAAYTRRCGMTTVALRLTSVYDLAHAERHRWLKRKLQSDDRQNDLWTYVDTRDAARAFRLAIENAPEGTHNTVIIAARDSYTPYDVRDLVRRHFPSLADQVAHLAPTDSVYDTRKAEAVMGWVAENSWREAEGLKDVEVSPSA